MQQHTNPLRRVHSNITNLRLHQLRVYSNITNLRGHQPCTTNLRPHPWQPQRCMPPHTRPHMHKSSTSPRLCGYRSRADPLHHLTSRAPSPSRLQLKPLSNRPV